MSVPDDLAVAEARLLITACAYVDADHDDDDLNSGMLYADLERARDLYATALRRPPLLPDHPLVKQGMAVVRRLLGQTGDRPMSERPTIVCLCGSTRFWRAFQVAGLRETLAGRIVLSIGAASGTDDEHFGNLPRAEYDRVKAILDELHLRKIDLADEVLVLNVDGYVGESTAREIAYARLLGKPIRWLEEVDR
jgi:hypothetical protein